MVPNCCLVAFYETCSGSSGKLNIPAGIVEQFKFLGSTTSTTLRWGENTKLIIKKAQQLIHVMRQLKKFAVNREIWTQLYRAVIESVLSFSMTVWYGSTTQAEKNSLDRVVRTASKIIDCQLPSLGSI